MGGKQYVFPTIATPQIRDRLRWPPDQASAKGKMRVPRKEKGGHPKEEATRPQHGRDEGSTRRERQWGD
jgi:hypothetical protein